MKCMKCGAVNLNESKFCSECGEEISGESLIQNEQPLTSQPQKKKGKGCIIAVIATLLAGILLVVGIFAFAAIVFFGEMKNYADDSAVINVYPVEQEVKQQEIVVVEEEIIEAEEPEVEVTTKPSSYEVYTEFKARYNDIDKRYDEFLETAMTQADMNSGSLEFYKEWDKLLNDIYQYLKETMPKNEFDALQKDEMEWVHEKEAAVEAARKEYEGGSMAPFVGNGAAITYTCERCEYLMSLIDKKQNL